uniref:Mitochondrial carrier protein n=1 Tax=Paramoeba aestuarina TaxID=180227 RepID=A0A7S4PMZ4_9EUKA|mmetsp:Transcript_8891/g.13474  ORF Transcript_8891/g.13474 Transcript_8891/m.13474 type:complete len:287 (+) Transcript_8891:40-900(+)
MTRAENENLPLVNFLAGGIGNSLAKSVMSPLSRLVVVMQLDDNARNVLPTLSRIIRRDGLKGLFRGNLTMVIHRFPYSGIQLLVYDRVKCSLRDLTGDEESTFLTKCVAGGISGTVATALCFPLDVVRTRLMSPQSDYNGIARSLIRITREEGKAGLYKGLAPTIFQRIPDLCIHFSVYETSKFWLQKHYHDSIGWTGCTLGASCIAGFTSVSCTLPLDVIRRRMMMDGAGGKAKIYTNMIQCGIHLAKTSGFSTLYRGFKVELTRVVPQVCLSWYLIESLRQSLI